MADTRTRPPADVVYPSPPPMRPLEVGCGHRTLGEDLGGFLECWWSDEIAAVEIFLQKAYAVATLTGNRTARNGGTAVDQLRQAMRAMAEAYADLPHHLIEDLNLHHTHRAVTEAARSAIS